MNQETLVKKPSPAPVGAMPGAAESPSNLQQIKIATIVADAAAVKAKWKALVPVAGVVWSKLQPEELTKVQGNFYVLTELLQLRYKLRRDDAEQQVKAFFDKHYGKVGASLRPR